MYVNIPCQNVAVENTGEVWHKEQAERIGEAVAARRKALGMTGQQLAARCADLGVPIHRTTITKIEKGRPRFDLGELIVLAAALNTSPVLLMYPGPFGRSVGILPGRSVTDIDAVQWFSALQWFAAVAAPTDDVSTARREWRAAAAEVVKWRHLQDLAMSRAAWIAKDPHRRDPETVESIAFYDKMIRDVQQQLGVDDG